MNGFVQWLMSPLAAWHTTGMVHKLSAGVVGAGAAYFLRDKPTWQIVAGSVGAAYLTTLALNAGRSYQLASPVMSGSVGVPTNQSTPVFPEESSFPEPPPPVPEVPIPNMADEQEDPPFNEGIFD